MISCTRKIHFDAAHRVMEHESKCRMLHGHRYIIEASFTADNLDKLGRVIDFGQIKELLQTWIDDNWDHNVILFDKDKELGQNIAKLTGQNIYYIPCNPTAENIGLYLFENIIPKLFVDSPIKCLSIRVNETPNCYADIS